MKDSESGHKSQELDHEKVKERESQRESARERVRERENTRVIMCKILLISFLI